MSLVQTALAEVACGYDFVVVLRAMGPDKSMLYVYDSCV